MSNKILGIAGWAAVLLIGVLSLVPATVRPHTGTPGQFEHLIAYFGTSLLFGLRVRERSHLLWIGLWLAIYSAILEIVQLWIPGRHSQFIDFVSGTAGVLIGLVVAAVISAVCQRRLHDRH